MELEIYIHNKRLKFDTILSKWNSNQMFSINFKHSCSSSICRT